MNVKERYYQVLEDSELSDIPMSAFEAIDQVMFTLELEKAFNVCINDSRVAEIFLNGTHEDFIKYIEELV